MNRDVKTLAAWVKKEWPGRGIPDAVHAAAERLAAPRKRVARDVGPDRKAQRKATAAVLYAKAKRQAATRTMEVSNEHLGPRCEFVAIGSPGRCFSGAQDPDHVIGGAYRKECERLGAEGLMYLCRQHHDAKHANTPTRGYWLDVAAEHAQRHGFARLARLVEKARARHEAKHAGSEARSPRGGRA
jgi:hypothetical protein